LNKNLESEVSRRTDEIRKHAEFTAVLNAPIDRPEAEAGEPAGPQAHPEVSWLLDGALASLQAATGGKTAGVLPPAGEGGAGARGAEPPAFAGFGPPPTREECTAGQPIVNPPRAILPILFRGEPEGAIVLVDDALTPHAVEFAARAAGPLAIALSNARAYAA